jgi:replicative DNA helicase
VCSQLSRAPEIRKTDRPKLSDLRESGAIEQDADEVLLLWDDPADAERGKPLTVIVAKQRNGPRGEMKLGFDRATGRFANWTERETPPWTQL